MLLQEKQKICGDERGGKKKILMNLLKPRIRKFLSAEMDGHYTEQLGME